MNNVIVNFNERTKKLKINLIDFGMSGNIQTDSVTGLTIDFAAYEILTHAFQRESKAKVDIFSFGSIMFHIYYRTSFANYLVKNYTYDKKVNQVTLFNIHAFNS